METQENSEHQQPPEMKPEKRSRSWGWVQVIGYAFALLLASAVGLFLYLQTGPAKNLIRRFATEMVAQNTGLRCHMGEIRGNIFAGFDIDNIEISDTASGALLLSADRVHISYSAPMLLLRVLSIKDIDMQGVSLHLVQAADGKWNVETLMSGSSTKETSSSTDFNYLIRKISATRSMVSVTQWTETGEKIHSVKRIEFEAMVDIGKKISAHIKHLAFECENPKIALSDFSGKISFDPENSRLTIKDAGIKTPRSAMKLNGQVDFISDKPDIDVHAEVSELSLPEIGDAISVPMPESGKITGTVNLKGTPDRFTHQLQLTFNDCDIQSEGLADINKEKGYELDLSAKIRRLNPAAIPLEGLDKFPGNLNADIVLKGWHLNMADRSGHISADFTQSDITGYQIDSGNVVAAINGDNLTVENVQLNTPYGILSGSGSTDAVMSAAENYHINLNADIQKFNPVKLIPKSKVTGNINVSFKSSIRVPKTFEMAACSGSLSGFMNASTINGYAIQQGDTDVAWTGQQIIVNRLHIENDMGQAEASGNASLPDRTCSFKVSANLPDLKLFEKVIPKSPPDAPLSGSLRADGNVSGKWDYPNVTAEIIGGNIHVGKASAQSLKLKWLWEGSFEKFTGTGDCVLNTLKIAGMEIPEVDVKTDISPDNARFALKLQGGQNDQFNLSGNIQGWLSPTKEIAIEQIAFTSDDLPPLINDGPTQIRFSQNQLRIEAMRLDSGEASVDLKGSLLLTSPRELSADLILRDFDLKRISDFWLRGEKIQGRMSSDLRLSGTADNPMIQVRASLKEGAYADFTVSNAEASVEFKNSVAKVTASAFQADKQIMDINGSILSFVSLYPFKIIPQPNGMDIALKIDQIRISDLPGLKNRDYQADGMLNVLADLSGDIKNPELKGEMKLADGFLNLKRQKLTYENLTADIRFTPGQVEIVNLHLKGDKEGTLDLSGSLAFDHFKPGEFNIRVKGKDFFVPYQTAIAAKVIPDLMLTGTWDAPKLSGNLTITSGHVNLDWFYSDAPIDIEVVQVSVPENKAIELPETDSQPLPFIDPLHADIKVIVPGNVWLKGTNENIEINGKFSITKQPGKTFVLSGPLYAVRGTYRFYGKVFNITEGELNFIGQEQEEINPPWSAVGEILVSDVKIIIRLAGTFEKVNLTLDSEPVMDQVDIISYLVFGQPSNSLSQKESFRAEDAALSITGQMAVDEIREMFGEKFSIDYMNLSTGGGDIRQGELAMGKYVAPRVFVIYRHGFSQEGPREVEVDYEINRYFNIQTQIDNEKTSAVDLIWKYEF